MRDSRYFDASRRPIPFILLVVMLVDLLNVDCAKHARLTLLVDSSVCVAQANCPIPVPLSPQAVVSVSRDGPRGGKSLHGDKVNSQRELLYDVPRYLRELFLGCVRQFNAHSPPTRMPVTATGIALTILARSRT
jgi:hypothetical protein